MDMWKNLISNKETICFTCKWRDECKEISQNKLRCTQWYYGDPEYKNDNQGEEGYVEKICGFKYNTLAFAAANGKDIKIFEKYFNDNCRTCPYMHEICMYGEED